MASKLYVFAHRTSTMVDGPDALAGECQRTKRLLEMQQRTRYELVQENGQRRLTSPEVASGERQRGKGAEVFLGRLPRDCYEDELMPMLEQIGRLLELRLMLDFSGSTRGYAFALYEEPRIAREACARLDGHEIRPGHRIGVVKSMDNCRLFFGGVPKTKTKEEFMSYLTKMLKGVTDVYLYPSAHDRTLNRGFIFVEFKDHRAAAMARRLLIPGRVMLWDHEVAVDWADPEPGDPVDEDVMETEKANLEKRYERSVKRAGALIRIFGAAKIVSLWVTALFVRNLALDMPQQKVREIFQKHTNMPILKLKKINHFAFIHYENRETAKVVIDIMQSPNSIVEKEGWEIRWAKPIGATKIVERQRHIREAVANSYVQNAENLRAKQSQGKKRNAKVPTEMQEDDNASVTKIKTLQKLIKDKYHVVCTYNCKLIPDSSEYIGKVIIYRDQVALCEVEGKPMESQCKAITTAFFETYHYLESTFINND